MRRAVLLLGLMACARHELHNAPTEPDAALQGTIDRDADGLCDASELDLGTDPDRADTDADGLLDGHELIAGTDARNREDPGVDHIVYLRAALELPVSLRVAGVGSDITGAFSDRNAFDPLDRRAGMFFQGSTAVSAQPPENARGVAQSRFEAVLGRTQLQFSLRFEAQQTTGCAAVLPFDYAATSADGTELTDSNSQEHFVLIVSEASPPLTAAEYCLPVACL